MKKCGNLILDEFCEYEPTNKDADFDIMNYKLVEAHVYYIKSKENKKDDCTEETENET